MTDTTSEPNGVTQPPPMDPATEKKEFVTPEPNSVPSKFVDVTSSLIGLSSLGRLVGATIAFFSAINMFGQVLAKETAYLLKPEVTHRVVVDGWWRGIPILTATIFGLALLRVADKLSVPLDLQHRVDLERAKALSESSMDKALRQVASLVRLVRGSKDDE